MTKRIGDLLRGDRVFLMNPRTVARITHSEPVPPNKGVTAMPYRASAERLPVPGWVIGFSYTDDDGRSRTAYDIIDPDDEVLIP